MKKVLIIINGFNVGGITVSLYSLLSSIDPAKVKIDIFARQHSGDYFGKLPNCNILKENLWLSHSIYHRGYLLRILSGLLLGIRKFCEKLGIDMYRLYNHIGGKQIRSNHYDAVIGFDESLSHYVSLLPARKRINMIHCDYRRYAKGIDESKFFDRIDTIVCVAESMRKVFCEYYPKYNSKAVAIHNIINVESIREKAQEPINDSKFITDGFTMISCGRLDPVKQFSRIPVIASKIKQLTCANFRWYIIGDGADKESIEKAIVYNKMQEHVIMLGKKINPYSYMGKANVYVCTSYSEAHPLVVNEARALRIPVVCNKFESAYESVLDGIDGFIVPLDNMHEKLADMIQHPLVIEKCYIENDVILNKIYSLFD